MRWSSMDTSKLIETEDCSRKLNTRIWSPKVYAWLFNDCWILQMLHSFSSESWCISSIYSLSAYIELISCPTSVNWFSWEWSKLNGVIWITKQSNNTTEIYLENIRFTTVNLQHLKLIKLFPLKKWWNFSIGNISTLSIVCLTKL